MICRLAGVPHQIVRPDGKIIESGGCSKFKETVVLLNPNFRLDRTAFYREMAAIDLNVIRLTGHRASTLSVAEILSAADSDEVS